jgi:hypothetical protein
VPMPPLAALDKSHTRSHLFRNDSMFSAFPTIDILPLEVSASKVVTASMVSINTVNDLKVIVTSGTMLIISSLKKQKTSLGRGETNDYKKNYYRLNKRPNAVMLIPIIHNYACFAKLQKPPAYAFDFQKKDVQFKLITIWNVIKFH